MAFLSFNKLNKIKKINIKIEILISIIHIIRINSLSFRTSDTILVVGVQKLE